MLSIGKVLILELKYSDQVEKYRCRLVERKGDILFIDYPVNMQTNRTAFLLDGTQLKINFVEGESAYLFETEIMGRVKREIPMIKLIYPGDDNLVKIQRRQYVRVEAAVDIAIHPVNGEFEPFTAITEDISAGGSSVITNKKNHLKQGMKVRTVLVLPLENDEYDYMDLMSDVVRIILDKETGYQKISLQFMEVSPRQRQGLFRFSFQRQLELKKKGLEFIE